jgi:hypothetical protein
MKTIAKLAIITFSLVALGCAMSSTDTCGTKRTIQDSAVLNSTNAYKTFATGFVAEKNCHAIMKMKFYWNDPAKAATTERPPLTYSFNVGLGYFPHQEKMSYDAALGYNVWTAEVNQGAKNETVNPISYYIEASYTGESGDGSVKVEMSIQYVPY